MPNVTSRVFACLVFVALFAGAYRSSEAGALVGGWNYAIDSQNDGSGSAEGFEMRGLAFQQVGNTAYFAISSGMPLGGIPWGGTTNNNISFGDLILNFSSHNLTSAGQFNDPNVFGIRFSAANDSFGNVSGSNTTLGLFSNITTESLMLQNSGFGTLQQYYDWGFGAASGAMGDLSTTSSVLDYFGNGAMFPNMLSGTKIGDITLLDRSTLAGMGVNFGQFGADPSGNSVFGFSLDASLLPAGGFTGSLFYECINDGTAIFGVTNPQPHTVSTPEPNSIILLGTGLATLLGWRARRRGAGVEARL